MNRPAAPLEASTILDRPAAEITRHLAAVDHWRRTAAAVGYRLTVTPDAATWADGQHVRLDRIGRRRRPVARHRAAVGLDPAGLPTFTVTRGPGSGGRLTLTLAEDTGDGVVLSTRLTDTGPVSPLRKLLRARHRRAIGWALRVLTGMSVLATHQTRVVVAAAVIRDGAVLAARRSYPPELAGRWEFPGGKVGPNESEAAALRRELAEELGDGMTGAAVGERIGPDVSLDVELVLRLYAVRGGAEPVATGSHDEIRWIRADALDEPEWLDADRHLLPAVRALLD